MREWNLCFTQEDNFEGQWSTPNKWARGSKGQVEFFEAVNLEGQCYTLEVNKCQTTEGASFSSTHLQNFEVLPNIKPHKYRVHPRKLIYPPRIKLRALYLEGGLKSPTQSGQMFSLGHDRCFVRLKHT